MSISVAAASVGHLGTAVFAEAVTEEPKEEVTEEVTEESTEESTEQPPEESTEKPEESTEESTEQPSEESTEQLPEESTEKRYRPGAFGQKGFLQLFEAFGHYYKVQKSGYGKIQCIFRYFLFCKYSGKIRKSIGIYKAYGGKRTGQNGNCNKDSVTCMPKTGVWPE